MKLIADLETDGLLENVTTIHCIAAKDIDTGAVHFFGPDRVEDGVRLLASADLTVWHNGITYDVPVLAKLYPQYKIEPAKVFDTLVATRLIWTNIKDIDAGLLKKQQLPGSLYGSHKLEAWGYRLKLQKGEYVSDFKKKVGDAYTPGMEWLEYSPEMGEYNKLDVEVTHALYSKILEKSYSTESLQLEHQVAWLMAQQMRNGFPFDKGLATELYAKLVQRRGELERDLRDFFRWWFASAGRVVPTKSRKVFHESPLGTQERRVKEKGKDPYYQQGFFEEFTEGAAYTKIKVVEFNPSSRDHIADRLVKLYGWKPEVFTDGGKPRVDEEVMGSLAYEPTPLLTEYLTVAKRISQLAEGDQAWMKVERGGKIFGSINTNGAVTGRCTHAFPNLAQVPASGSPYGPECRSLFTVPEGWLLGGSDASGLELRCLAHFMARYDGGKYANVLLDGDIHTENQKAAGLPTRNHAKTFIYGYLYGAGDEKIGKIVGRGSDEGRKLKAQFLKKTPALKNLSAAVKEAAKRGYLVGLDKRLLHVRHAHAALNTLLQSAGALVCKHWIIKLEELLKERGYKHGWDGDFAFLAYVHDEVCLALRTEEVAEAFKECSQLAMKDAERRFGFRCQLDVDVKIGKTWYDVH